MKTAALTAILYGVFLAIGGYTGYHNAGSKASLISGGLCGLVLVACGLTMRKAGASVSRLPWGIALVVTLLVVGRFAPAFIKTGHWWPAGITAGLGVLALMGLILGRK